MRSQNAIDLILADDEAERARLERQLHITQEEMVNHFIELFAEAGLRLWPGNDSGNADERRKALRTFIQEMKHQG